MVLKIRELRMSIVDYQSEFAMSDLDRLIHVPWLLCDLASLPL